MGRHEGDIGQHRRPGVAERDQIVAVGAVAMNENAERFCAARCRWPSWAIKWS
jgi:hypothetical protein